MTDEVVVPEMKKWVARFIKFDATTSKWNRGETVVEAPTYAEAQQAIWQTCSANSPSFRIESLEPHDWHPEGSVSHVEEVVPSYTPNDKELEELANPSQEEEEKKEETASSEVNVLNEEKKADIGL